MPSDIFKPKKIENGISFNVKIETEIGNLYILGLRVWKGLIMPPATRKGHSYFPSMKANRDFCEWVYQRLIDHGWDKEHNLDLKKIDLSIDPLLISIQEYCQHYEQNESS